MAWRRMRAGSRTSHKATRKCDKNRSLWQFQQLLFWLCSPLCNVHQLIQSRCWENLDWMLAQRLNASTNQTRPLIAANRSNQPGCIIRYTNGEINIRIIWRKIFIWNFLFQSPEMSKIIFVFTIMFYIRWPPAKLVHFFRDIIGVPQLFSPGSCCGDQTCALIFDGGRGDSPKL